MPVSRQPDLPPSLFEKGLPACILLMLLYVLSGKLGLMLALPPGYASPIFPPAGIAVAAALIGGRKTWPWVLLGALLLNVWIGYSSSQQINAMGLAVAGIIAVASTLQAAIGGMALRKLIGYPTTLGQGKDIVRFLLMSPVICLTSSSLSVGSLLALGVIDTTVFASNWAAWWIGDTLGVIVMLPLVMTIVGEPHALWKSRRRTVAIPMLLVFAIFVAAYLKINQWEYSDSLSDFHQYSQQATDQLRTKLESQESLLEQTAGLFIHDSNREVTRNEFHRFVQKALGRFQMIQALEWAPQVGDRERADFETMQRKSIPDFEIRERQPDGQLRRAASRNSYQPVTYVEPQAGNEPALGFDLASNPQRREAINKAIQLGAVVVSPAIKLVQEHQDQQGILLLMAVHPHDPGSAITLSVLRLGDFIDKLLPEAHSLLYVRLLDLDDPKPLYDNFAAGASHALYEQTFSFGTRRYRLETAPTPAYFKEHQGWQSWGVLTVGILSTGLLGALLLLSTGYTARIEAQVEDRTRKLQESQQAAQKALDELQHQKFALDQHAIVAVTDLQGTITYANQRFCEISGYTEQELIGQNHRLLNSGKHPRQFFTDMYQTISSGEVWKGEICNRAKNGTPYWVMTTIVPYLDDNGLPIKYIAIRADITERKQLEEQIRQMAYYDALTKLPNRRLLLDRLAHSLAAKRRHGGYGALMFLDLDNFKPLNDTYGHEAGDMLLIEAATRLLNCVRETDTVTRLGGDEFVVMLDELDADKAASTTQTHAVAEKILAALSIPYRLPLQRDSGQTVEHRCTASIGVTLFSGEDNLPDDILKRADMAMYRAKEDGRGQIRFSPDFGLPA